MSRVLIIGGGAAGMFAAIWAARNGHSVSLYEKNEKAGKKLFITGKGRCNLTNACDMDTLFSSVVSNSRFLYSSFYGFTNQDLIEFFENIGVPTKTERGGRVFPVSDHSSDVIKGLLGEMERLKVKVHFRAKVREIETRDGAFYRLMLSDGREVMGEACIVATGGLSYKTTGSTGDGLQFAKEMGHKVTPCLPSLVPIEVKEPWIQELMGLSLKNVKAAVFDGNKRLYEDFGEMLFTHYGVSGPLILSASSYIGKKLLKKAQAGETLRIEIDLKPALDIEALDRRVLRDFDENQNRQFKNALGKLFPSKLIPVMIELSGILPEKKINVISKDERAQLVRLIKHFPLTLTKLRDYDEAIITKGGVNTKEIDPGTMESKLVKGVYFVGEVLDLDGLTGGFNLQIAWSTAFAAGNNIAHKDKEIKEAGK